VAAACAGRFPHQALFPHGPEGRGLLSRTPLSDVRFEQGAAHRRQLFARVAVGEGFIDVAAVHLSVLAAVRGAAESSAAHLIDWAATPGDHPRLLLGDFNSTPTSGVSTALKHAGLIDAFAARGRGAGFTFPVAGRYNGVPLPPFLRLDQAWCSADCQVLEARVAADGGGDHLPLAVRLRLP
ncbi:MAG: endonuclease/exonuclease/phosphatase family protein, partial [Planctomycetota bacterium]